VEGLHNVQLLEVAHTVLVLQLALRTGLQLLEQVHRTEMVPELRQKAHLSR
jgi:hypothetical protein